MGVSGRGRQAVGDDQHQIEGAGGQGRRPGIETAAQAWIAQIGCTIGRGAVHHKARRVDLGR